MRAATKEDIRRWLKQGQAGGASHMIVYCDTFNWSDYPVYVIPPATVAEARASHEDQLMEIYDLSMDIEAQLGEHRAMHP